MAQLYREHDALLFPVRWDEPWGLVPLEAMASGCPVIATGRGGSGEYLRDGENCLLVPAEDPACARGGGAPLAADPRSATGCAQGGPDTAPRHTEALFNAAVERHLPGVAGSRLGPVLDPTARRCDEPPTLRWSPQRTRLRPRTSADVVAAPALGAARATRTPTSASGATSTSAPASASTSRRGSFIVGDRVEFRRGLPRRGRRRRAITIGSGTHFTYSVLIQCSTTIDIGERCMFGQTTILLDGQHRFRDLTRPMLEQGYDFKPLRIEDDATITTKCTIMADIGTPRVHRRQLGRDQAGSALHGRRRRAGAPDRLLRAARRRAAAS